MRKFIRHWLGIDEDLALGQLLSLSHKTSAVIRSQAVQTEMYRDLDRRISKLEILHEDDLVKVHRVC